MNFPLQLTTIEICMQIPNSGLFHISFGQLIGYEFSWLARIENTVKHGKLQTKQDMYEETTQTIHKRLREITLNSKSRGVGALLNSHEFLYAVFLWKKKRRGKTEKKKETRAATKSGFVFPLTSGRRNAQVVNEAGICETEEGKNVEEKNVETCLEKIEYSSRVDRFHLRYLLRCARWNFQKRLEVFSPWNVRAIFAGDTAITRIESRMHFRTVSSTDRRLKIRNTTIEKAFHPFPI